MKVFLFLGDLSSNGGIERVTISLANALARFYDVYLVSLYAGNKRNAFKIDENVNVIFINNDYEISMYNRQMKFLKGSLFDLGYIFNKRKKIFGMLKDVVKPADILISCDVKMTLLLRNLKAKCNAKLIAIEHFEHDVGNPVILKLKKYIYPGIEAVVSLTAEDKNKYSWLPANKHVVIPNILALDENQSVGSSDRKNIAIAVGRLTKQKGFDLLLKAWSKAKTDRWHLHIIGDGEEKEALEHLAVELKANNIIFLPFQNNIAEHYQQAKIFILSSRYEGLGMVLLEALSYELACISFACPAGPKTILSQNNGILVAPEDVDKMSEAITRLISDEFHIQQLSSQARESISMYRADAVVVQWKELLRAI